MAEFVELAVVELNVVCITLTTGMCTNSTVCGALGQCLPNANDDTCGAVTCTVCIEGVCDFTGNISTPGADEILLNSNVVLQIPALSLETGDTLNIILDTDLGAPVVVDGIQGH